MGITVMSGNGFANLRAKFENQTNDTSPPSRGRSPAAQENATGNGTRKVRTNFISVGRSGLMGSSENQRESIGSTEEQPSMASTVSGTESAANGNVAETTHSIGVGESSEMLGNKQDLVNNPEGPEAGKAGNGTMVPQEATKVNAVNPDKPLMGLEEDAPSMQPSDPKDEIAVSGGAALAPQGESLGALLKGSEFEPEGKKAKNASPKKPTTISNPSTPKKTRSSQKTTPGQPKAATTPKMNESPRAKPDSARPSSLKKPEEDSAPKPNKTTASVTENSTHSPQTSTSPTASKTVTEPPPEKAATPKLSTQQERESQPQEENSKKTRSTHTSARPSTGAKPAQPTALKTKPASSAATGAPKAPKVTSPSTAKPRPKSPTRPVRLPGAATAMTAASAAKTGTAAPPQLSSRASLSNTTKPSTLNKPNGTKVPSKPTQPAAQGLRQKAPRSSLAASTAEQKAKPRMSTASTKASGGDFLSRMMRPTQSSASKTHEKVEQKTPPKKRISSRPKRISDATEKSAESKSGQASIQDEAVPEEHAQARGSGESNHSNPVEEEPAISQEENKGPSSEQAAEPVSGA
ncbi:MAG: hypothetical protein LQ348_002059 [Seirophora lacunosa]|nr:MAG: hypothetical protein LQ348_002059 [Seirophora lacunosa]